MESDSPVIFGNAVVPPSQHFIKKHCVGNGYARAIPVLTVSELLELYLHLFHPKLSSYSFAVPKSNSWNRINSKIQICVKCQLLSKNFVSGTKKANNDSFLFF